MSAVYLSFIISYSVNVSTFTTGPIIGTSAKLLASVGLVLSPTVNKSVAAAIDAKNRDFSFFLLWTL